MMLWRKKKTEPPEPELSPIQVKYTEWVQMELDCIINALQRVRDVMDDPDCTVEDVRRVFTEEAEFLKIVQQTPPDI